MPAGRRRSQGGGGSAGGETLFRCTCRWDGGEKGKRDLPLETWWLFRGESKPMNRLDAPASSSTDPWHSRGYLPHFDQSHLVQSLIFRLHDAVPAALLDSWRAELARSEKHPSADS